ncbi:MAG: hypothetical protein ACHQ4H_10245, partial [Ktedonobacterales bacterium]
LKDFIAAIQAEFDLNPKQAMEKLGVKTLSGLNLREALEMLRRQALRGDPATAAPIAAPPVPVAAAAPAPMRAPATEPAHYFEEEDDAGEITYTLDEHAPGDLYGGEEPPPDEDDEFDDIEDLPDFGAPPAPAAVPPAARPAAAPRAPAAAAAGEGDRAGRIIGHMRGVHAGGTPGAQQRGAYGNIVVAELGEPKAKALVAALWHLTPEKLGPEQLEALISWGKRETFAEDTELVLAALKAERERASAASTAATASEPAARTTPRAPRRAAPAGGD